MGKNLRNKIMMVTMVTMVALTGCTGNKTSTPSSSVEEETPGNTQNVQSTKRVKEDISSNKVPPEKGETPSVKRVDQPVHSDPEENPIPEIGDLDNNQKDSKYPELKASDNGSKYYDPTSGAVRASVVNHRSVEDELILKIMSAQPLENGVSNIKVSYPAELQSSEYEIGIIDVVLNDVHEDVATFRVLEGSSINYEYCELQGGAVILHFGVFNHPLLEETKDTDEYTDGETTIRLALDRTLDNAMVIPKKPEKTQ